MTMSSSIMSVPGARMILGHSHPHVVEALKKAVERGTSFGAPTELEITLAKMISTQCLPFRCSVL